MPKPPTRTRRKDARPGEIVQAALASFAERGFAATKLEAVAAAAGISKGTIYLYFPTKQDLFRAVVEQAVLPNVAAAEAAFAAHEGSAADLLRLLVERFFLILDSDLTGVPKMVIAEAGNFPEIAQYYVDTVVRRSMHLIETVLTRGVARGEFRPLDIQATIPLISAPFLLLTLWKHSLGRHTDLQLDARAVAAAHLEVLLRGLAAGPPAP
jgi:AcrR family transcriptional regulator